MRFVPLTSCGSCEVLAINGLRAHEIGCPSAWRDERRECRWCGQRFAPDQRMQRECSICCCAAYNGTECPCDACVAVNAIGDAT